MSLLQSGIARKLHVGQARAAESELVGADRHRCEKVVCAGGGNNVVLVHAVPANADGADENAIAIRRNSARKNRDPIWQISAKAVTQRRRTRIERRGKSQIRFDSGESGKFVLFGEERSG